MKTLFVLLVARALCSAVLLPTVAFADDEDERALFEWERDDFEPATEGSLPGPELELAPALSLSWTDAGQMQAAGFVLIGGSFETAVEADTPAIPDRAESSAELRRLLHADPDFVRALMRAALAAHDSDEFAADVSDVETRARLTGLVPELKLRVARQVDEDQALAPTEYDPDRLTASGGVSTWLEARATFNLDHLVYANDEPGLLRLSLDRAKFERELLNEVAATFSAWQRARAAMEREGALPEEVEVAEITSIVEASKLDALTDGFFSRRMSTRVSALSAKAATSEPVACPRPSDERLGEQDPLGVALNNAERIGDRYRYVDLFTE